MIEETIGPCRLIYGDCGQIVPKIPSVDTVFTSPPYNCGKDYGTASDALPMEEYENLLRSGVFGAKARVYMCNVGQYVGSREDRLLTREIVASAAGSLPYIDEIIWDKGPPNGAAWGNYPNSPRLRAQHESIFIYGSAKMPNGNGLTWQEWSKYTSSIWRIHPKVDLSVHPAMMPVELARRAIALWSDKDGTILDPFMGSGTTAVACIKAGRKFIGIEIDKNHFDTSVRRVKAELSQLDMFNPEAAA